MKKGVNKSHENENCEVINVIATYSKETDAYIKKIDAYTKELKSMPVKEARKECRASLVRTGVLTKTGRTHEIVK